MPNLTEDKESKMEKKPKKYRTASSKVVTSKDGQETMVINGTYIGTGNAFRGSVKNQLGSKK